MKLRVYLDTSIFSAYYDDRLIDRQIATKEFWLRLNEFEISTSEVTCEELAQTKDEVLRINLQNMLKDIFIHTITEDVKDLARYYVSSGVFSQADFNDALHVAVAVMNRQDVILSWNFKHLVNRMRRAQINHINISLGFPVIDIVPPPEL